jgi:hypothetical protein
MDGVEKKGRKKHRKSEETDTREAGDRQKNGTSMTSKQRSPR